ncbi:hypothetical protein [Streptomyces sp. NPDC059122]|uniref:hypothetical protein n=1 Tax=Streptomyces sp. NPDC059122 TaxID=3346732 RepID=UPI0036CD838E
MPASKPAEKAEEETSTSTVHTHSEAGRRTRSSPPSVLLADPSDVLADELFYATVEECEDCRTVLLDCAAQDARAVKKLVDWALWITSEVHGGLPDVLVDQDAPKDTLFHPSDTFRRLAQGYGTGQTNSAQHNVRGPEQRREVADDAVTLVAGLDRYGADFLYW